MPGCGETMPFREMAKHFPVCQQQPIACTVTGCEEILTRGTLTAHLSDSNVMPKHMRLLSLEVERLRIVAEKPELVVNSAVVFCIPRVTEKFNAPTFRYETRLYTLPVYGAAGYTFRIQLRKRKWTGDRRRFNDKLGVYLHMEHGESDPIIRWPFPYDYTFTILDQTPSDPVHIQFSVNDGCTRGADWLGPGSGKGWGPQGIASFEQLATRGYTHGDRLYMRVDFDRESSEHRDIEMVAHPSQPTNM
eukprot:UC1_evm4s165